MKYYLSLSDASFLLAFLYFMLSFLKENLADYATFPSYFLWKAKRQKAPANAIGTPMRAG